MMMGKGCMSKGLMGMKGMGYDGCFGYGKGDKGKGKGKNTGGCDPALAGKKIFVGALPKNITDEAVKSHFSQFGNVTDVSLRYGPDGSFRGFGFVSFENVEAAQAVFANYENNRIDGKWIDCKTASQQNSESGGSDGPRKPLANVPPPTGPFLRLRGMPFSAAPLDIVAFLGGFTLVRIVIGANQSGQPSGEALVEFSDQSECERAFNEKQGSSMGHRYIELFGATPEDIAKVMPLQTWSVGEGGMDSSAYGAMDSAHIPRPGPY